MKTNDTIVWAHHGLFAAGPYFDTTFGLAHTVEKAAELYVAARAANGGSEDWLNKIEDQVSLTPATTSTLPSTRTSSTRKESSCL